MKNGDAITLPETLRTWVEIQAAVGGFESVDEYVSQVLREERRRQAHEAIEKKLLASIASGPATPMTEADWEELRELARSGPTKKKRHASKR